MLHQWSYDLLLVKMDEMEVKNNIILQKIMFQMNVQRVETLFLS